MVAKKKLAKKSGDGTVPASQDRGLSVIPPGFLADLRHLITETRSGVAVTVNIGMTLLYWRVGIRVLPEILRNERAGYGEQIVHALSAQLKAGFGEGFGICNLFNMIRFAEVFPDEKNVRLITPILSWTHLRQIIYIEGTLKRDFYVEMCRIERWSTGRCNRRLIRCFLSGLHFQRNLSFLQGRNFLHSARKIG